MQPLVVTGMYGIGDNIHQRAVLKELMKTKQVWLRTCYNSLYHDLVDKGLIIVPQPMLKPRIKENGSAKIVRVPNTEIIKITYNREATITHGSLLAAQFASAGLTMPEKPDFSLEVKPSWREDARKLLAGKNPTNKPLLIYRPAVLNKVWACPARCPDVTAYSKLFKSIKDRFFTVSVADITNGGEHIVGREEEVDLKLNKGEANFETLVGLFAEASLVYACPGYAPILAQAVGTPGIVVYGGNESYRTTNLPGSYLAPTLAIEPIQPCECFFGTQKCGKNCDKVIDIDASLLKIKDFVEENVEFQSKTLIFGTVFVDSEAKKRLVEQWMKLHKHLNPGCDLLLVDSSSPIKWSPIPGVKVFDFGNNIGHLARNGKDGWGRAFSYGLQAGIDGNYDYVVHIEGDSLFRKPINKQVSLMKKARVEAMGASVEGTRLKETDWAETGLMFFNVDWLIKSDFVKKYNWQKRTSRPTPEAIIHKIIAEGSPNGLVPGDFSASRGDNGCISLDTVADYDWVTHCTDPACYDRFVDLVIPPAPLIKLNFGCGTNKLDGWKNFDIEVNITKPLPFPSNHADFIYAEHCVEHVDYREAISFFNECHRVLKPGGVIRICVPSLENVWKRADKEYIDFVQKWAPTNDLRGAMHAIIYAHGHKAIWSQALLEATIFFAGFEEIAACEQHKSRHRELADVEGHHRVIGEHMNWIESAIVEGRK